MRGRRWFFVFLLWGVTGTGVGLLVSTVRNLSQDLVAELLLLLLIWLVADFLAVPIGGGKLTATWSLLLASFLKGGVPAALWLGGLATFLAHRLTSEDSWRTSLFNAGQVVVASYAAACVFHWLDGKRSFPDVHLLPAALSFALVYFLLNHLLVRLYYWGRPRLVPVPWQENLKWDAFSYLFTLPIGYLMAVLWFRVGFGLVPLVFLAVLCFQFLLRWCLGYRLESQSFALMQRLTSELRDKDSVEEACHAVLQLLQRFLSFRTGAVWLRWQRQGPFVWLAGVGPWSSLGQGIRFRPGEGWLGEVVANGEPVVVSDTGTDPRLRGEEDFFRAERVVVGWPLLVDKEPVGVLFLGGKSTTFLSPLAFALLVQVTDHLALYLAQWVWRHRWHCFRQRDPLLPDVWSRPAFLQRWREECQQALDNHEPLALLLVDVDGLRSLNCRYGPMVGDAVLFALCQLLMHLSGLGRMVARYGGDCFAILLPGAAEKVAQELAEKIRQEVENRSFTVRGSHSPLHLRVSVAVTIFPADAGDFATALQKAEKALAEAKARGGNQVVMAAGVRGVKFFRRED
ncbi:diguanylate cyclase domain-containing protein [Desulfothermobacter acidiphilus]|uniref:sensor domain-containing diguanylate cyclase n=1 Tax=Desulfothermobacter acidiphilus TaxID=1938353 RepID=UPI003F8CC59C